MYKSESAHSLRRAWCILLNRYLYSHCLKESCFTLVLVLLTTLPVGLTPRLFSAPCFSQLPLQSAISEGWEPLGWIALWDLSIGVLRPKSQLRLARDQQLLGPVLLNHFWDSLYTITLLPKNRSGVTGERRMHISCLRSAADR